MGRNDNSSYYVQEISEKAYRSMTRMIDSIHSFDVSNMNERMTQTIAATQQHATLENRKYFLRYLWWWWTNWRSRLRCSLIQYGTTVFSFHQILLVVTGPYWCYYIGLQHQQNFCWRCSNDYHCQLPLAQLWLPLLLRQQLWFLKFSLPLCFWYRPDVTATIAASRATMRSKSC